jgi:hypothetical protein
MHSAFATACSAYAPRERIVRDAEELVARHHARHLASDALDDPGDVGPEHERRLRGDPARAFADQHIPRSYARRVDADEHLPRRR